ncbi:MAG: small basic family protein [Anaerovoracaceae bacterium]
MIVAVIVGLALGLFLGFALDIAYPAEYSFYITMGLLAAMDSIVGAVRSMMEEKYNNLIFISGFITNGLLAMLLTYIGDKLGVPLYFAAIFVFGGRLFNNLAVIRRLAIDKYFERKKLKNQQNIEE